MGIAFDRVRQQILLNDVVRDVILPCYDITG